MHAHHDHSDIRSGMAHTHAHEYKAHAIVPIQQCTPAHVQCKTYRVRTLFNPVHASERITEILLVSKDLQQQKHQPCQPIT